MNAARRLISFSFPYRRWLLLAFVLIMFTSLAINFLPVLLQRITDECLLDGGAPIEGRTALMLRLGILYISIAAIGHLVRYVQAMLTAWIGQRIIYDLRLTVFDKVLRMQKTLKMDGGNGL